MKRATVRKLVSILIASLLLTAVLLLACTCSQDSPLSPHYSHTTYSLEIQSGRVVSDTDWVSVIEKNPDKDFVILNLTDIQLGTGEYLADFDHIRTMVTALIEKTKPDLITVTGDMS